MKTIKTLLTFGIILSASSFAQANDYALLKSYPLLNDMKIIKQEQILLKNMKLLISDRKNNHKDKISKQKKLFSKIIIGLERGDKKLKLHGTELKTLKDKIQIIKILWSQEKGILDSAVNNKMYTKDAYKTISKLSQELKELQERYRQSYARYKKNAVMKSVVSSYMKKSNKKDSKYALNVVK